MFMRRIRLFIALGALLIVLASCQLVSSTERFEPRMGYDEVKLGAFRIGFIPKEYLEEDTFVKFKSTSGLYGYLYILDPDPLKVDWLVFDEDGEVLKHGESTTIDRSDFDGDGIEDVEYQGTSLVFNSSEDSPALFSYDFPNEVFSFTPEGGKIYKTDPDRFKPTGASPTATLVYYDASAFPEDVKEGDVIFDVSSYPYLGDLVIRKVLRVERIGEVVEVESTPVNLEDVIPVLELKFEGGMEKAVPLNEDAQVFLGIERSDGHLLNYEGSKTIYSGKYATVTASYGFSLDASFGVFLDYDWNSFDAQMSVSVEMSHDLILRLRAGANYEKSGESKPFFEPSFTFSVYGIPVVTSFPMYAGYSFDASGTADATVGYRLSGRVTLSEAVSGELSFSGIDVDHEGDWSASGDADLIGPEYDLKGKISLRTYIGIDVKVSLAKMVYAQFINHPYLKPEAEAHIHGDPYPDGKIDTEIGYGIDFSIKAGYDFKAKKDEWKKHLKDWKIGEFGPWTFGLPAPPSNLEAKFRMGKGVILSWHDNSSYEDGYLLEKEFWSGGTWVKGGEYTTDENATSYTDSDVVENVRYRYTVKAYSDWPIGHRYESQGVSYEIEGSPPPKPTDPRVLPSPSEASLKPTLIWRCEDETGDTLSFDLYLGDTNPPPLFEESVATGTGPSFSYILTEKLSGDTEYFWKIVVHDSEGFTTEGDVWTFRTIPEDKGYIYIRGYNRNPNSPIIVAPPVSIEGIRVAVDGEGYTTPATILTNIGEHTIKAQYYPDTTTRDDSQWLFKMWILPKESNDTEISVEVSDDVNAWFVAGLFYRVSLTVTGDGTADIVTQGRRSFYENGSVITLVATPYEDSEFDGWYANGILLDTNRETTVEVSSPVRIEARFRSALVTLRVSSTPIENVDVLVDGERHTTPFQIELPKGEHRFEFVEGSEGEVGNASTLHYFESWNMGGAMFDDNPLEFDLATNVEMSVNLDVWYKIDGTVVPEEGGTLTFMPHPKDQVHKGYMRRHENLSVRAVPNEFYRFEKMTVNGEDYGDDFWSEDVEKPLDFVAYFEFVGP